MASPRRRSRNERCCLLFTDCRPKSEAVLMKSLLLCAVVSVLAALPAPAQTATSNLRGYVRGEKDAPVGSVEVSMRSIETNQRRATTTAASGYYYIGGLRPGQ